MPATALPQFLQIVGKPLLDLRPVGKADDHHLAAGIHLIEHLLDAAFGLVEPVRSHIGCVHARRIIDEEDVAVSLEVAPLPSLAATRRSPRGPRATVARSSSRLCRIRCQRLLTRKSSIDRVHK